MIRGTTIQEILEDESQWTKGANFRCNGKSMIGEASKECDCCCLFGAAFASKIEHTQVILAKLCGSITELFPARSLDHVSLTDNVINFNDHRETTIHDARAVAKHAGV